MTRMRLHTLLVFAILTLGCAGVAVASPQDEPPPAADPPVADPPAQGPAPTQQEPPAPEPEPAEEPLPRPKSDPAALEILEAAAKRQNADGLAHEGVSAFHVVFGRAQFERDGNLVTADPRGLVVDWAAPDRIRTRMVIDGNVTERGARRNSFGADAPWAFDGKEVTALTRAKHPQDFDQIDRDRRMVRALIDVVFLRRMLEDESVWKREPSSDLVEGGQVRAVGIRRIPPAPVGEVTEVEGARLAMVLLIDAASHDVRALLILPATNEEPAFQYEFEYSDGFPKVSGAGDAEVRFPFKVTVSRIDDLPPPQVLMVVHTETVAFNAAAGVTDATFSPPK